MTELKRPLKVFLCHAHSDQKTVYKLYLHLKNDGIDAWLDKEKIIPGQDWKLEIRKAVSGSDVVVVCLSKQFNQTGFRQKEVKLALDTADEQPEGEIFIIPARLEECDNLESLQRWHWVDLFEDNGYEMLMWALRSRAEKIGASVKLTSIKKAPKLSLTNPADPNRVPAYIRKLDSDQEGLPTIIPILSNENETNIMADVPKIKSPKIKIAIRVVIIGIVATLIALLVGILPQFIKPIPAPTLIPNPFSTEITDTKGVPMILIPAGKFTMGSDADAAMVECYKFRSDCNRNHFTPEEPVHIEQDMPDYYMDIYEVTNKFYRDCVDTHFCSPPVKSTSFTRSSYYGNAEFDNYPVISVTWEMAKKYCEWRGARLPTEKQWEKAARGTDNRIYPWGNDFSESRANSCDKNCPKDYANGKYNDGYSDTAPVNSYEDGKSPYGIYNMAGNVWEWTADWYNIYAGGDPNNPDAGRYFGEKYRTIRGGSWDDSKGYELRVSNRGRNNPTNPIDYLGFRCARSIP